MWAIGIIVAFVAGGILFGKGNISNLSLFALILICPLMMLFMHGGGHSDHEDHKYK